MRKLLVALSVIWLVASTSQRLPAAGEFEAAATQAGVASADGKVHKSVKGGPWQACAVGDILTTGDRIRTGNSDASTASLMFTDKTVMRLAANTTITLVDLSETADGKLVRKFSQEGGRSWSDVTPNPAKPTTFEVRGPNAVAAVKGTSFEVDAESGETDVLCWEGEVDCLADGQTGNLLLKPGRRFQARKGKAANDVAFSDKDTDGFQDWNLQSRDRQRAIFAKLPPRVKLNAVFLMEWARKHQIKLNGRQRQKLKRAFRQQLQQRPRSNPR